MNLANYFRECIPVPMNATKDDRVWVANRFHNRITNRKIGRDLIRVGSFPDNLICVSLTKQQAVEGLLAHREMELECAKKELARAERAMKSALEVAGRDRTSA